MSRPTTVAATQPRISDLVTTPGGRWFTITFEAGERLATHRSVHDLLIEVSRGSGELHGAECGTCELAAGAQVAVAAHEPHEVVAGSDGLLLTVRLRPSNGGR
jgi:quercetin dioxygenase-like cupin family protein